MADDEQPLAAKPDADVAEQQFPAVPEGLEPLDDDAGPTPEVDPVLEADPADVVDQHRVELDEDEPRR
ncbi:hypothetical protein [Saccharothrix obliqua]|uniref:hypothetical protein n=1 Tax=Saccharothrix obliqua TaxID=2861747 RepID=UPI001C5FFD54|nr:hypothetical protein [Saccharothrix obliqua]MBW4720420.1 hypothetical protein [Saccharothrix obliqua]